MAFKQCDKCGKWYEPKDDNALCEDCVNNQHHETYNLSSVLTNEQAVTIKKRNNFFWWFIVAGMLLSASSYLVYFLPQQKIWWLIVFFCIIDLSHYFVFLVKFCFDESKDKIKKSISFVIGYIVGLFLLFLLILCLQIGADAVAKLWADGLFCIIFSAPVACVVFKLLPFLLEALETA